MPTTFRLPPIPLLSRLPARASAVFLFAGAAFAAAGQPPAQPPAQPEGVAPAPPPHLLSARTALDAYFYELNQPEPDWERLTATLDFDSGVPDAERRVLAARLRTVINAQGHWVEMNLVPSDPDYRDEITRQHRVAPLPVRMPEFVLTRGDDLAWRISKHTIRSIETLYEETFSWYARSLFEVLPPVFDRSFLGFTLWQVVGLLVLGLLAWAAPCRPASSR